MPVYLCYAVCGCEHSSVLGAMPCYVKGERTSDILHKPDGGLRNAGDAAPLGEMVFVRACSFADWPALTRKLYLQCKSSLEASKRERSASFSTPLPRHCRSGWPMLATSSAGTSRLRSYCMKALGQHCGHWDDNTLYIPLQA